VLRLSFSPFLPSLFLGAPLLISRVQNQCKHGSFTSNKLTDPDKLIRAGETPREFKLVNNSCSTLANLRARGTSRITSRAALLRPSGECCC